ncbi:HAD family hydrolase [Paenibacillus oryzisoli]|uniref:HAD family hydrolase n=1 Tax=Paenibacillus oryzisoli TaxID=1850517 RepID=UPI003D2C5BB5
MPLNKAYEAVKQFHETFEHPIGRSPQRLTDERKAARLAWMQEELDEFKEAATLEDEVDAMIDELYFVLGTLVEMGVEPGPIFDIVQHANMSKVWPDGLVHKNELGKTIKPPDWEDPFDKIRAEIHRQQMKKD